MMRLLTLTLLSSQPVLDFCRGRDAGCPAPPAQIRTGRIAAYGSYLGCLAAKRRVGWGWRVLALGIQRWSNGQTRPHVIRSRWLRRRSARYQRQMTWARKLFKLSMLPGTA